MENNKYQHGKIYRITDNSYTLFYYGSTVQELSARMSGHRRDYQCFINGKYHKVSVFDIFDEFGTDSCKIELVELFPCDSKDELRKREGYHIQNNECVNKRIAGRTRKEWAVDNKDRLITQYKDYYEKHKQTFAEKGKQYRAEHTERIRARNREYQQTNKETIKEQTKQYREANKDKLKRSHKEYYENHKDERLRRQKEYVAAHIVEVKERLKNWYVKHRDELKAARDANSEQLKEKTVCAVCGSCYNKRQRARHERSLKHQAALNDNINN